MATSKTAEIKNRILTADPGTIFLTADFADITSITTIRKCLGRLVESGTIRRVLDGIYEKPRFSTFLQKQLPTNPEAVAYAIAKFYHWNIAPSGDIALNKLGLSTQVPIVWSYISDGPYREYNMGNITLSFKHRTNRDISNMSVNTVMVIEALKSLGKPRVNEDTIQILKTRLSDEDKRQILKETIGSAEWINNVLRKVCE